MSNYELPGEEYNPKQPNWDKIKDYKDIVHKGPEMEAHKRDVY